jgi:hypothetical protein
LSSAPSRRAQEHETRGVQLQEAHTAALAAQAKAEKASAHHQQKAGKLKEQLKRVYADAMAQLEEAVQQAEREAAQEATRLRAQLVGAKAALSALQGSTGGQGEQSELVAEVAQLRCLLREVSLPCGGGASCAHAVM